jgi:hypothetical protein
MVVPEMALMLTAGAVIVMLAVPVFPPSEAVTVATPLVGTLDGAV